MEKKVIRVGSVGVGAIWGGVHEPGIAKSPDLTLVAICDIDEKKLEAVGEKYGIPPQYRFTVIEIWLTVTLSMQWISAPLMTPTSRWQWLPWKPASRLTWKSPSP